MLASYLKNLENVDVGRLTAHLPSTSWHLYSAWAIVLQVPSWKTKLHMHMEIIIQVKSEISVAVKIHAGGDEKQKINKIAI